MLENLFGDKPWYKSLTAWGIVTIGVAQVFVAQTCDLGLLSVSVCATATKYLTLIGAGMATLGIRKASTAPNTK